MREPQQVAGKRQKELREVPAWAAGGVLGPTVGTGRSGAWAKLRGKEQRV